MDFLAVVCKNGYVPWHVSRSKNFNELLNEGVKQKYCERVSGQSIAIKNSIVSIERTHLSDVYIVTGFHKLIGSMASTYAINCIKETLKKYDIDFENSNLKEDQIASLNRNVENIKKYIQKNAKSSKLSFSKSHAKISNNPSEKTLSYGKNYIHAEEVMIGDVSSSSIKDFIIEKKENTGSWIKSIFSNENVVLTDVVLRKMSSELLSKLIEKNVAVKTAENICKSAISSLKGKILENGESPQKVISAVIEDVLTVILSDKQFDIFSEIELRKYADPYCIVFIGVNGVGKSTSLAKICYWALKQKKKVLIAACDTFRSGAVEQLKIHVNYMLKQNLGDVFLYENGYGKDSAIVAKDAIKFATENKYEIVLIDTAGRMQNNEPHMKSLEHLIKVNNPDRILYVGESLVGNESISQLTRFNEAVKTGSEDKKSIDGIIATKFDAVEEKVGSIVSMSHAINVPVIFVGTGQKYDDISRVSPRNIARVLLF